MRRWIVSSLFMLNLAGPALAQEPPPPAKPAVDRSGIETKTVTPAAPLANVGEPRPSLMSDDVRSNGMGMFSDRTFTAFGNNVSGTRNGWDQWNGSTGRSLSEYTRSNRRWDMEQQAFREARRDLRNDPTLQILIDKIRHELMLADDAKGEAPDDPIKPRDPKEREDSMPPRDSTVRPTRPPIVPSDPTWYNDSYMRFLDAYGRRLNYASCLNPDTYWNYWFHSSLYGRNALWRYYGWWQAPRYGYGQYNRYDYRYGLDPGCGSRYGAHGYDPFFDALAGDDLIGAFHSDPCAAVTVQTSADVEYSLEVRLPALGVRTSEALQRVLDKKRTSGDTVYLIDSEGSELQLAPGSVERFTVKHCSPLDRR